MIKEAILRLFVLYKDEEGQALAEYGLILGLIAVVAIAALTLLGAAISGEMGSRCPSHSSGRRATWTKRGRCHVYGP